MPDWIARRCLVSGRVQGVWYRAATRERAVALGVTGHALNLADGLHDRLTPVSGRSASA